MVYTIWLKDSKTIAYKMVNNFKLKTDKIKIMLFIFYE